MPYGLQPTGGSGADKIEVVSGAGFSGEFSTTQIDEDNSSPAVVKPVPAVGAVGASATVKITTDVAASHYAMVVGHSLVCIAAGSVQYKQTINGGTTRVITPVISLQIGDKLEYSDSGVWFHYDQTLGVYSALAIALSRTVFTSGSGTYTPPVGCRAINVRAQAGGAGSGGVPTGSSTASVSGGGGAGGFVEKLISPPASSYSYAVGGGGNGGTAGANAGTAGTDTTFGSLTAKGGTNSVAGITAGTSVIPAAGGAGGIAGSGGDINPVGQAGLPGFRGSGTAGMGGNGGSTPFGAGGIGAVAAGAGGNAAANSGAGGGGSVSTSTSQAGGNGGSGVIMIDEWF